MPRRTQFFTGPRRRGVLTHNRWPRRTEPGGSLKAGTFYGEPTLYCASFENFARVRHSANALQNPYVPMKAKRESSDPQRPEGKAMFLKLALKSSTRQQSRSASAPVALVDESHCCNHRRNGTIYDAGISFEPRPRGGGNVKASAWMRWGEVLNSPVQG